jgi:SAM-dependent methyltransferase
MSSFWDHEVVLRHHVEWMSLPAIRAYINRSIGGEEPRWPIDWFQWWLGERRFDSALSIGCGAGALERDLIRRNLCRSVDAFDASVTSLHMARLEARKEGFSNRIRYFAGDFNSYPLSHRQYDIVFFHQSAHHVLRLEWLFSQILDVLRPGGLLYLDEYIGPSRTDWNEHRIAPQREVFEAVPVALRSSEKLPLPIQPDDPTEALRSSEIEEKLRIGFDIAARRPYGGTLLSVILPNIKLDRLDEVTLSLLIGFERALLAAGMQSFYAVIVACPRRGVRRLWGKTHYLAAEARRRFNAVRGRYRVRT